MYRVKPSLSQEHLNTQYRKSQDLISKKGVMYTTSEKNHWFPVFAGNRFSMNFARLPACGHLRRPCKRKEKRYNAKRRNKKPPLKRGVGGLQGGENAGETKARHGGRAPCRDEPRLAEEGGTCPQQSNGLRTAWRVAEGELHLAGGRSTERSVCKGARSRAFTCPCKKWRRSAT